MDFDQLNELVADIHFLMDVSDKCTMKLTNLSIIAMNMLNSMNRQLEEDQRRAQNLTSASEDTQIRTNSSSKVSDRNCITDPINQPNEEEVLRMNLVTLPSVVRNLGVEVYAHVKRSYEYEEKIKLLNKKKSDNICQVGAENSCEIIDLTGNDSSDMIDQTTEGSPKKLVLSTSNTVEGHNENTPLNLSTSDKEDNNITNLTQSPTAGKHDTGHISSLDTNKQNYSKRKLDHNDELAVQKRFKMDVGPVPSVQNQSQKISEREKGSLDEEEESNIYITHPVRRSPVNSELIQDCSNDASNLGSMDKYPHNQEDESSPQTPEQERGSSAEEEAFYKYVIRPLFRSARTSPASSEPCEDQGLSNDASNLGPMVKQPEQYTYNREEANSHQMSEREKDYSVEEEEFNVYLPRSQCHPARKSSVNSELYQNQDGSNDASNLGQVHEYTLLEQPVQYSYNRVEENSHQMTEREMDSSAKEKEFDEYVPRPKCRPARKSPVSSKLLQDQDCSNDASNLGQLYEYTLVSQPVQYQYNREEENSHQISERERHSSAQEEEFHEHVPRPQSRPARTTPVSSELYLVQHYSNDASNLGPIYEYPLVNQPIQYSYNREEENSQKMTERESGSSAEEEEISGYVPRPKCRPAHTYPGSSEFYQGQHWSNDACNLRPMYKYPLDKQAVKYPYNRKEQNSHQMSKRKRGSLEEYVRRPLCRTTCTSRLGQQGQHWSNGATLGSMYEHRLEKQQLINPYYRTENGPQQMHERERDSSEEEEEFNRFVPRPACTSSVRSGLYQGQHCSHVAPRLSSMYEYPMEKVPVINPYHRVENCPQQMSERERASSGEMEEFYKRVRRSKCRPACTNPVSSAHCSNVAPTLGSMYEHPMEKRHVRNPYYRTENGPQQMSERETDSSEEEVDTFNKYVPTPKCLPQCRSARASPISSELYQGQHCSNVAPKLGPMYEDPLEGPSGLCIPPPEKDTYSSNSTDGAYEANQAAYEDYLYLMDISDHESRETSPCIDPQTIYESANMKLMFNSLEDLQHSREDSPK